MKEKLFQELKAHKSFKISVSVLFAVILIFSVQLSYYQANQNADRLENNVERIAELREASAFMQYYNRTNQSEKYSETRDIAENTLKLAQQQTERSKMREINLYLVASHRSINPLYPEPCSLGLSGDKCYLYLDQKTLSDINNTLSEAGSSESLREFSSKNNLTVSEIFYTNYSKERFTSSSAAGNIDALNNRKMSPALYTANILYMALIGFILSSIISRIYREVRGA